MKTQKMNKEIQNEINENVELYKELSKDLPKDAFCFGGGIYMGEGSYLLPNGTYEDDKQKKDK